LSVDAKKMSRELIDTYFRTVLYPYTKHHIDSYDTFLQQDLKGIIKANNPILILKDLIDETNNIYKYKVELYIGGEDGEEIQIGTPTLHHQPYEEIRVLYPNEARLRNLTYASTDYATILVKITYTDVKGAKPEDLSPGPTTFNDWPLFTMPIMLHSSYCILHNKPKDFLKQAGECPYDNGGYFIVDGAEKVLITRQEKAFNTLYISILYLVPPAQASEISTTSMGWSLNSSTNSFLNCRILTTLTLSPTSIIFLTICLFSILSKYEEVKSNNQLDYNKQVVVDFLSQIQLEELNNVVLPKRLNRNHNKVDIVFQK
jgi:DNA-directed RNA polymerase beta subunit